MFALRVAYLLGALEGLWAAYAKDVDGTKIERKRLGVLLKEVRGELSIESIFGKDWWSPDGVWRYEVDGEEPTFQVIVDAHPLVKKWIRVVQEEVERAGVRVGVFEGEKWERGRVGDGEG